MGVFVNRKRHRGTHADRIAYARQLWESDPALPQGTPKGVTAQVRAKFGLAPTREQLQQVHMEVAREQRDKRRRDAILEAQANRQPVISMETARRLRLVRDDDDDGTETTDQSGQEIETGQEIDTELSQATETEGDEMGMKARPNGATNLHASEYFDENGNPPANGFPKAFRQAVVASVQSRPMGTTINEACQRHGISHSVYYEWLKGRNPKKRKQSVSSQLDQARIRVAVYEDRKRTGAIYPVLQARHGCSRSSVARYANDDTAYKRAKELLEREGEAAKGEKIFAEIKSAIQVAERKQIEVAERKPLAPPNGASARESVAAAVRLLVDEVPDLASLSFSRDRDGSQKLIYTRHTVIEESIEL